MARPFPSLLMQNLPFSATSSSALIVLFSFLSLLSIITFSCATRDKKSLWKTKGIALSDSGRIISKINSNISSKALSMVKMISWKKAEEEEEEEIDGEEVWRKTIMRGERCRPLDFSGKILYDSEGNLMPELPGRKENVKASTMEKILSFPH